MRETDGMTGSDSEITEMYDPQTVVVCRCEEVLREEVAAAIAAGAATLNDVKRYTRAGMGLCQGIFCMPAVAVLLAQQIGAAIEGVAPMTARAPVRPIRLEALADLKQDADDVFTMSEEG
jgi:NAD(P)H-nitrite reductase large subunit